MDQKAAHARPGWQSDSDLIEGHAGAFTIMVATGKSGPLPVCADKSVLVALKQDMARTDCTTIDASYLQENGSVAIYVNRDGPRIQTAREAAGQRPWTTGMTR